MEMVMKTKGLDWLLEFCKFVQVIKKGYKKLELSEKNQELNNKRVSAFARPFSYPSGAILLVG